MRCSKTSHIVKLRKSNLQMTTPEIRKQKEEEILKRHLGENTIVTRVYAYNENVLQFYCGSSGFLDAGTYTGFLFFHAMICLIHLNLTILS